MIKSFTVGNVGRALHSHLPLRKLVGIGGSRISMTLVSDRIWGKRSKDMGTFYCVVFKLFLYPG